MTTAEKVLGQKATAATTAWDLYTCTAPVTSAVITCINVCNRGATSTTFRISVRVAGAGQANDHYQYYDVTIAAYQTIPLKDIRWTLSATDVITVYAGNANLSFTAFGSERTN